MNSVGSTLTLTNTTKGVNLQATSDDISSRRLLSGVVSLPQQKETDIKNCPIMGGNQSILTVPSRLPNKDALYIKQIFNDVKVEIQLQSTAGPTEQGNELDGGAILQLPMDTTLFLVPSMEPCRIGWVVQDTNLLEQLMARNETMMLGDQKYCEIQLPSDSILLLVPSKVVESSVGRLGLARCLSKPVTSGTSSVGTESKAGMATTTAEAENVSRTHGGVDKVRSTQQQSKRDRDDIQSTAMMTEIVVPMKQEPPRPSKIVPTLQVQLLQQEGQYQPNFPLNAQIPIPFETDLFVGQAMIVIKPNVVSVAGSGNSISNELLQKIDPYWYDKIYSKKNRRIVIQYQGKFKRQPRGVVYAGAEISDPMQLGLVTRGVAGILLGFVERFNSTVHYSYGDIKVNDDSTTSTKDGERSHIVVPAYTFFENLIVTKPGDTPPKLGEVTWEGETKEQMKQRKSGQLGNGDWNTTDTYSFSFYSMYIDLPTWSLVQLPVSGNIALQTFWGQSSLFICMYEKLDGTDKDGGNSNNDRATPTKKQTHKKNGNKDKHLESMKTYAFSLKVNYLNFDGRNDNVVGDRNDYDDKSDETEDILRWTGSRPTPFIRQANTEEDASMTNYDEASSSAKLSLAHSESNIFRMISDDDPDVDEYYFDAGENIQELDDFDLYVGEQIEELQQQLARSNAGEKSPTGTKPLHAMSSDELLSAIDDVCPFWVEVCSSRSGYGKVFAIVVQERLKFRTDQACRDLLHDIKEIRTLLERSFSPRMSSNERTRRAIGIGILLKEQGSSSAQSRLNDFIQQKPSLQEQNFLKRTQPTTTIVLPPEDILETCAFVGRAISDRHWIEEWATVSNQRISFFHPEKRRPHFNVRFSTIMSVAALDAEDCPVRMMVGSTNQDGYFSYLAVQTIGRTIYLMFRSESTRNEWLTTINTHLPGRRLLNEMNFASPVLAEMDNPADEFMHKSSMWSCKNRRILNCGLFSLHSRSVAKSSPLELVERALKQAMDVLGEDSMQDFKRRHEFLISAAILKDVGVSQLSSESEKMVLFLNLYHVMIMHAYIVIGAPDRSLQWINYFNNIAYQVGDDIFSLTELEHCIIRAQSSLPSQFLSRFVIPKSRYNQMALNISDHRVNFALNCGSKSNPEGIFVYKVDQLNDQLDEATRLHLTHSASVQLQAKGSDIVIVLPRVCQWFFEDFGGSEESLLQLIQRFLPIGVRKHLESRWLSVERRFDMKGVTIKYQNFQFECRPLSLATNK